MIRRALAILFAAVFAAAACGQVPNAHQRGVALGEAADNAALGQGTGNEGGAFTGPGGSGGANPGTGPGSGPGNGTTGSGDPSAGGVGTAPAGPQASGQVWCKAPCTVKIGLHAPITGAAPVTDESFVSGRDLYWNYGNNGGKVTIYGRSFDVVIEDDHYDPAYAQSVCKKMVEQDRVFLLVGGAGADQIVSCARYAWAAGVPYLSAGVAQQPLAGYGNYFALSETYPQQMPQLASYIKKNFTSSASRVAMVAADTVNFNDAVAAFQQAFSGVTVIRVDKDGGDEQTVAGKLCTAVQKNYDVVVPLVSPVYWLNLARRASCNPQWAGAGITQGIDAVADAYCKTQQPQGPQFFSPTPAFHDAGQSDKTFIAAANRDKNAGGPDDIKWILWNLSKTLAQLLQKAGPNLSRASFLQAMQTAQVSGAGFPNLRYTPSNHFGASGVNVLELICEGPSGGYYRTKKGLTTNP
jgi:branched-chain amino acid transport system substrate-binding protein